MSINWGLIGGDPNIGGRFQYGLETGLARRKEAMVSQAAAAYAANPRDPQALGALAAASPQFAVQLGTQRGQMLDEQERRARIGGYFRQPNLGAARQTALESGDVDTAKIISEMDDAQRETLGKMYKAAGGIAMGAKQLPYEQRKQYIMTNAPLLKASGWSDEQISQFDPSDQALDGMVRYSTEVTSLLPKTVSTVPGGGVMSVDALTGNVNTLVAPNPGGIPMGSPAGGDPTQNLPRPNSQQEVEALPPGSQFIAPDGSIRTKGGQPQAAAGTFQ